MVATQHASLNLSIHLFLLFFSCEGRMGADFFEPDSSDSPCAAKSEPGTKDQQQDMLNMGILHSTRSFQEQPNSKFKYLKDGRTSLPLQSLSWWLMSQTNVYSSNLIPSQRKLTDCLLPVLQKPIFSTARHNEQIRKVQPLQITRCQTLLCRCTGVSRTGALLKDLIHVLDLVVPATSTPCAISDIILRLILCTFSRSAS